MVVGLVLRLTAVGSVLDAVSFDYQMFFNLLLPPIILSAGYELHQVRCSIYARITVTDTLQGNFFRHIGSILTFAFAGTFISAVSLGLILFLWTRIPLDGFKINFVEAMSVGATLSATDPVTILAIFDTYKVEPKLYTLIFGESILNDAVAIVLFETAQKYKDGAETLGITSLFEAFGIFFGVFFGSLFIGVMVGIVASLTLKFTYVRRYPKTETCLIILVAYLTYFFSNAIHMSGKSFNMCNTTVTDTYQALYHCSSAASASSTTRTTTCLGALSCQRNSSSRSRRNCPRTSSSSI